MRRRCRNPKDAAYPRYGGRGITVCVEWADDFPCFERWASANGYRDDLTLDRRNNDRGYAPDNCRWATYAQQNSNYSRNVRIIFEGTECTVLDLAKKFGLKPHTLRQRLIKFGWDVDRAVRTPSRAELLKRYVVVNGERRLLTDAAKAAGIPYATVRKRLERGWSAERALKP